MRARGSRGIHDVDDILFGCGFTKTFGFELECFRPVFKGVIFGALDHCLPHLQADIDDIRLREICG
jgi:hypothetical protein